MRLAPFASATCLSLLAFGVMSAPEKAVPEPAAPTSTLNGDAAAKHAKRTACLKDAKEKKLVGPNKTAFLKDCIGAPPAAS